MMPLSAAHSRSDKRIDTDYYVEGYAAKYEKYELFSFSDGTKVYERFERGCFEGCEMDDVILQFDHQGRVYARMSNGSLIVEPDDKGLFVASDLSRTEGAKDLYGDISAGMITKMSWGFLPGEYYWNVDEQCFVHTKVQKIYDVSAVSIPANDGTGIYTRCRSTDNGVIIMNAAEEFRRNTQRKRIQLLTLIGG